MGNWIFNLSDKSFTNSTKAFGLLHIDSVNLKLTLMK